GWETRVDAAAQDVRQALRRLRSRPVTSLAAIAMLGVGIGITTAMFTIVDALLLRPVPFRDANRLAQVVMFDEHGGRGDVGRPLRRVRWRVLSHWCGSPQAFLRRTSSERRPLWRTPPIRLQKASRLPRGRLRVRLATRTRRRLCRCSLAGSC